jgi:GMP synthase-like glutamine amidotransferase
MRILVVEQHDKPSLGVVGETLHDLGVEWQTVWGARGDPLPANHREHGGIIVLGGAMSALDDEICPYFPALTRLIHDFAEADRPVLGICLGAQLIARSFDADLHIGGDLEFGFHTVAPTPAAAEDPVLGHLDGPLRLFQWHTDHYALPPGAVRLATGETYDNQAYRVGRTVYGMQFHFEVTGTVVRNWIDATPELEERVPGYRDWLPGQFEAHEKASHIFCRNVTRRWIALA